MRLILLSLIAAPTATIVPIPLLAGDADASCGGGGAFDFCGTDYSSSCEEAMEHAGEDCADNETWVQGASDCDKVGLCYTAQGDCTGRIPSAPWHPAPFAPPGGPPPGPGPDCICGTDCRPEC